jgi:hypothetical protein
LRRHDHALGAGILGALLATVAPWTAAQAFAVLLLGWVAGTVALRLLRDGGERAPRGGDQAEIARRIARLEE